jgi:LPXTG-motif cell wall-anchored protein
MKFASRTTGAIASLTSLFALTVALPASAAVTGEWGVWSTVADGPYSFAIDFDGSSMPDALVDISDDYESEALDPFAEDEGFTAADPVGALVGANGNSTEDLFLKVSTTDDNNNSTFVVIQFASPVPAGQLVLAISDIDSDNAIITMTDENGDGLTATQIIGTATETGFNWDDPANTDDVPVVSAAGATSVAMDDAPDGTDGSTGWVRPSAAISAITLQISTEDNRISSERIWVGQVIDAEDHGLANTGLSDSMYLVAFAGAALIATAGIVRLRTN